MQVSRPRSDPRAPCLCRAPEILERHRRRVMHCQTPRSEDPAAPDHWALSGWQSDRPAAPQHLAPRLPMNDGWSSAHHVRELRCQTPHCERIRRPEHRMCGTCHAPRSCQRLQSLR
eukprot:864211-Prymnesium_polylepis.2